MREQDQREAFEIWRWRPGPTPTPASGGYPKFSLAKP
jgi:hypothetical protein